MMMPIVLSSYCSPYSTEWTGSWIPIQISKYNYKLIFFTIIDKDLISANTLF